MAFFNGPCPNWGHPHQLHPFIPRFVRPMPPTDQEICDVWHYNLEAEFQNIQRVIQRYKYVALDTEFPGVVYNFKPQNGYINKPQELAYLNLKTNADSLKLIQIGMAFFDEYGNTPARYFGHSTWQFHFQFNLHVDMYALNSIEFLKNSGIQFERHRVEGILHANFAELLMMSGVVLMDTIKFVSFHGCYDFAYLMRILTNAPLPPHEKDFFTQLKEYFPTIYDVEHLAKTTNKLFGGLQTIGDLLSIKRVGVSHQAGSDALLTGKTFFKLKALYFNNHLDDQLFCGRISGLSLSFEGVKK